MEEYEGSPASDAGLLAAAEAVEHYEMSRYGTLRTLALELGDEETAEILPVDARRRAGDRFSTPRDR
jgi:ferritin-like metal-binding protein YciE